MPLFNWLVKFEAVEMKFEPNVDQLPHEELSSCFFGLSELKKLKFLMSCTLSVLFGSLFFIGSVSLLVSVASVSMSLKSSLSQPLFSFDLFSNDLADSFFGLLSLIGAGSSSSRSLKSASASHPPLATY